MVTFLFDRCPDCGRMYILFRPKRCQCGYEFEKKEEGKDYLVCPKCGTKLTWEEIDNRVTCPGCGEELNKLFVYPCPKCGKPVGVKDRYCQCGEQLIKEVKVCPRCGKEVDFEARVCSNCGYNFYEESIPPKYYCPYCGMELPTPYSKCPVCGSEY